MKYFRAIAMLLIIALASSPALAAICATSCASQALISSMNSDSMANMKNCHQSSINKNKSKPSTEHKSCTMGAGCHFTQLTTPSAPSSNIKLVDEISIIFPKFVPSVKSTDLSPPLKPPA